MVEWDADDLDHIEAGLVCLLNEKRRAHNHDEVSRVSVTLAKLRAAKDAELARLDAATIPPH